MATYSPTHKLTVYAGTLGPTATLFTANTLGLTTLSGSVSFVSATNANISVILTPTAGSPGATGAVVYEIAESSSVLQAIVKSSGVVATLTLAANTAILVSPSVVALNGGVMTFTNLPVPPGYVVQVQSSVGTGNYGLIQDELS